MNWRSSESPFDHLVDILSFMLDEIVHLFLPRLDRCTEFSLSHVQTIHLVRVPDHEPVCQGKNVVQLTRPALCSFMILATAHRDTTTLPTRPTPPLRADYQPWSFLNKTPHSSSRTSDPVSISVERWRWHPRWSCPFVGREGSSSKSHRSDFEWDHLDGASRL